MPVNSIGVNPGNIALTYNVADQSLTGNTKFTVTLFDIGFSEDPGDVGGVESTSDKWISYTSDVIFNFDPPTVEATKPKFVNISINPVYFNLPAGEYSYELSLTATNAPERIVPIYLKVIDDTSVIPEPPKTYKEKYNIQHSDPEGIVTVCEIHQLGFLGNSTPVNGTIEYSYQDKKDLFDSIIASSLKMQLEASLELSLQDLYSEEEKTFKVILKRDNKVLFIGFLKPDGIFEDYVYDIWTLSIDAYDGLSTLKNIAFTSDNGTPLSGKYSMFDIIKLCLHKTGLDLPININCDVFYDTYSGFSTFQETFVNTQRFYQSSEPMDCEAVLTSILKIFNATIVQMRGEWFIYRPIDLKEITTFTRYVDGLYVGPSVVRPNVSIGSEIDGFDLFHANKVQRKSTAASVPAYRIIYQYGGASSVLNNSGLQLSGSGLDIPGWTVETSIGGVRRLPGGAGLASDPFTGQGSQDPPLISLNQSIDIVQNSNFVLRIRFGNFNTNTIGLRFAVWIEDRYFNLEEGQWQTGGVINKVVNSTWDGSTFYPGAGTNIEGRKMTGNGDATYEAELRAPVSGKIHVTVFRDRHNVGNVGNPAAEFRIYNIEIIPSGGNVKSRDYTGRRKSRTSTVTKANETVYNGDSKSDLYVGTIYKKDADTPTEKWYRAGRTESKELLEINAEDNLRLSPRPMFVFEGDLYGNSGGFIPYLSVISINGIPGKYQPVNWSFQTNTGVLKLTSREFSSDYINPDDFFIDIKDNMGEETQVKIV